MFARVLERQSETCRSELVGNKLKNDVLPILQKQSGFVDFLHSPTRQTPIGCCASVFGPRGKMPRNFTASTMT